MTTLAESTPRQSFTPAIVIALILAGALSGLAYVVFSAYAPDLSGHYDSRANALSHSAIGYAAIVDVLRAVGVPVVVSHGLTDTQTAKASLIVLTPTSTNSKEEIAAVGGGARKLIVLPKWKTGDDLNHPGWVFRIGLSDARAIDAHLLTPLVPGTVVARRQGTAPAVLHDGFDGATLRTGPIESLQTLTGPNLVGYVIGPGDAEIVARNPSTRTYLLADPDLLNTRGLHDLATTQAAVALIQSLRASQGPVVFDVTLAGYRRSPNLLRLLFQPPLVGATLCALAAAFLLGAHAAVRFGAPVPEKRVFAFGKEALVTNSAALIGLGQRERFMVARYVAAVRRRVAHALGVPTDQTDKNLNAALDQRRPPQSQAKSLAMLDDEVKHVTDNDDALRLARAMHRWRQEMLHDP